MPPGFQRTRRQTADDTPADEPDRDALRRYNLQAGDMNRAIATALAGEEVGTVIEGNRRFPIVVRLAEDARRNVDVMKRLPVRADETASLYQHCVRAILRALKFGERGLPLMGTGDWNDGMNRVGSEGKGESVWTGWFLLMSDGTVSMMLRSARTSRPPAANRTVTVLSPPCCP